MKGTGTQLRHLLDLMEADIARVYVAAGRPEYRPRYSPIVRTLVARGPLAIRELAEEVGVTHSAVSQTVAQLAKAGFVTLAAGADARQRIVHLTEQAHQVLPLVEAEWEATGAAMAELDRELPVPLGEFLGALRTALERESLAERIARAGQITPV